MKNIPLILSLVLILTFSNCEKQKIVNTSIIGKWKWEMTEMLGGNARYTTDSVDSTYFIEFKSDGYRYIYNNSNYLVDQQKYELVNENTFKLITGTTLDFGYSIKNDTLIISNITGFIIWTSYYNRLK